MFSDEMLRYVTGETRQNRRPNVRAIYDSRATKAAQLALEHLTALASSSSFPMHRKEAIFTYQAFEKLLNAIRAGIGRNISAFVEPEEAESHAMQYLGLAALLARTGLRDIPWALQWTADSALARLAEELFRQASVALDVIGSQILRLTVAGPRSPERGRRQRRSPPKESR